MLTRRLSIRPFFFFVVCPPLRFTPFPYTTLFRSITCTFHVARRVALSRSIGSVTCLGAITPFVPLRFLMGPGPSDRSEERRVGDECSFHFANRLSRVRSVFLARGVLRARRRLRRRLSICPMTDFVGLAVIAIT